MQIEVYRIEHPRLTACWVADWSEWAGEHNSDFWTEYDDEDEAYTTADAIGGIVQQVQRQKHYGDVIRSQAVFQEAAE